MSKRDRNQNEIEKVPGVDPSYLANYQDDTSLEGLKGYRIVPRLKIVQNTSASELRDNFGVGSAIVRPGDVLVCRFEEGDEDHFFFVPLFFFAEACKWADLKKAGSGPSVIERTFDQANELFKMARDPDKRFELYEGHGNLPEKERCFYRYVEHLRFIGMVYGEHPLAGTPITLSYERGEFGQGRNFISAVSLRRQKVADQPPVPIPLWAQVWKFSVIFHEPSSDRKWYGFAFEAAGIIKPDEAEFHSAQHKEFKELFDKQRIVVDDDGEDTTEDTGAVKGQEQF